MTNPGSVSRSTLGYHEPTGTYHVTYARATAPPSTIVVEAVATIADRDVKDMDPLLRVIDPDALNALAQSTDPEERIREGEISFTYHDHEIAVRTYGIIEIQPPDDE